MSSEVARRAGDGIQNTLRRLASLVGGLVMTAGGIGVATFITGIWVFHSGLFWFVIGALLCLFPVLTAVLGWMYVRDAARHAPRLIEDITAFIASKSPSASVLIDYDTGQPISKSAKRFGGLRDDLASRKMDHPSLWAGVRAVTLVPALAAITVLGLLAIGALGTIMLIVGLAR